MSSKTTTTTLCFAKSNSWRFSLTRGSFIEFLFLVRGGFPSRREASSNFAGFMAGFLLYQEGFWKRQLCHGSCACAIVGGRGSTYGRVETPNHRLVTKAPPPGAWLSPPRVAFRGTSVYLDSKSKLEHVRGWVSPPLKERDILPGGSHVVRKLDTSTCTDASRGMMSGILWIATP